VSCRKLEKLKFSILTFGCRCNQAESDAIRKSLCCRSMVEIENRISSQVMKHRLNALLEISRAKNIAFRRRFTGQVLPGITISREENLGTLLVLTGNYIHARVPGLSVPPNRLVNIRIEEVLPEATHASICE
jgi:tRNA A37 methylthiotransferase MiaB